MALAVVFTWPKTACTDKARGQQRSSTSSLAAGDVYKEIPAQVRRQHSLAIDCDCALSSLPSDTFAGTNAAHRVQLTPKSCPGYSTMGETRWLP